MISKGEVMSPILISALKKIFLEPFLINRVKGGIYKTREVDRELWSYLDRLGGQKEITTKEAQGKVKK